MSTPMRPPFLDEVQQLLTQIDRLKHVHRTGEAPTFGQVEALFDQAALVRAALVRMGIGRVDRHPAWPTAHSPVEQAARRLVTLVAEQLHRETAPGAPGEDSA